jgi:DNA-binding XRE family transcriptional regulator
MVLLCALNMENLTFFGTQIIKRREQLRLNQTDLALIVGLSDKTVRAIEKGNTTVAIKNWILVANAVGLEINLAIKKMSDETRKGI